MSTTAGSAAVRYQGTSSSKSVNARYRNNSDLRLSSGVSSSESPVSMQFTDSSVSTKVPADVNNRRDTKSGKDDEIIAVKDAEYIDSFPVVGEDQASKTEYIRKYLLDTKNTCRTRPIQLIISVCEIRICDAVSEVPMMTHVLKRIAFATCSPEYRHFSFVAREPKGSADDQYCHAFLTKTAREAEELNRLVAAAFSAAYAHSQSSSSSRESAVPPTSLPGPTLPQSTSCYAQNPPLTPMPISGSPALTFQDMLRGAHRDRDATAFSYAPTSSSSSSSGPTPLHAQQQETGSEELATRLQQISTASVDLMVVERRQRRSADSVGTAVGTRAGTEEVPASTHVRSSAIGGSPTASQKVSDSTPISRSCSTTKSPLQNSNGCVVPTTAQNASCITACSVNDINNAFDTMLLSNLLRTLKFGGGGDTRHHGSPVMILKELIDFHFINRAFNEDQSANDNGFMSTTKLTSASSSFQLPTFSFLGSRQEAPASSKKSVPSAAVRPRPLSGLFSISNGDGGHVTSSPSSSSFNKIPDADATIVSSDSPPRVMESPRNGCDGDGDLTRAAWYQPGLPRETVLEMLIQQDVGAFVVRDSTTHAGCYALSIRVPKYENESGISHYLITRTPRGTVKLKGMAKEWLDLTALVTHHTVMRELLPCLLVMPRTIPITGVERYDRANSVC